MNLRKIGGAFWICAMLMGLFACTTVGVIQTGKVQEPRGKKCGLDVYSSEKEIIRPFQVVCLIDVKTGTSLGHNTTGAGAVNYARPYACKCGADGLIILRATQEGDGFFIPKTGVANVKAIKYTDKK